MTEPLLSQQLESPSGTGRVDPEVRSDSQAPHSTNGIPTSQPPHSHWQLCMRARDPPRDMALSASGAGTYAHHDCQSSAVRNAARN